MPVCYLMFYHDSGPNRYRVELYDPVEIDSENARVFEAATITASQGTTIVIRPNGERLTFSGGV